VSDSPELVLRLLFDQAWITLHPIGALYYIE
jgi:hypothetical protein